MSGEPRPSPSGRLSLADHVALGTSGLRMRKLRAALSALGIAIAVATVVVVTSIPASSQAALDQRLRALGSDVLRVDPLSSSDTAVTMPTHAVGMLGRIGGVHAAATVGNAHVGIRSNDRRSDDDSVLTAFAIDGPILAVTHATMRAGRLPAHAVVPTVALGAAAARQLGITVLPPRAVTISIGGIPFEVVGVLRPIRLSPDLDTGVFVSRLAAGRWLGYDGRATVAYVTADERLLSSLPPVLAATLSPRASGLMQVSRPSDALIAKQATQSAFSGIAIGLATIALAVGGIGIANTMFVAVLERRREIGVRRALGARRGHIRTQFLIESVVLCLLGGTAGAVLGVLASTGWALAHHWPPVVPGMIIGLSAAAVLVVGVVAGIGPSIRAARQDPTIALASE